MKINKQVKIALLGIGIAVPIILYLYYMFKFGVDIPFWDEWDDMPFIRAYYNNENLIPYLFAQHNEHRIFFPRLLVLALIKLTDWNIRVEMFVSWIVCCCNFVLIWLLMKQSGIKSKWILIPVAWLLFSLGQYENIIWGWQLLWHLAIFGMLGAVYFLTKSSSSRWYVLLSIVLGILTSFSLNNGLLIWPLGVLLIWLIKRQKQTAEQPDKTSKNIRFLLIWAIIGIFIFIIYYSGYSRPSHHLPIKFSFYNPIKLLNYILINLGAGLGGGELVLSTIMGLFPLAVFVYLFFLIKSINKDRLYQLSPWFVIGLFAILSSCATAVGRSGGWTVDQSLSSRYITTSSLLIIADAILCVSALKESSDNLVKKKILIALNPIFFILIIIGLIITTVWGWKFGEFTHSWRVRALPYLKHFEAAPDEDLKILHTNPGFLREMATFLRDKKLSVFRVWKEINLSDYQELQPSKEIFFGNIDCVEILPSQSGNTEEDIIAIAGWAIDPVTNVIPKGVFILCDGKLIGRAFLDNPRPDIAQALKNNDLINSGWEFVIRKNKITPGAHKIIARVVFQCPGNYFKDITKEVKIE